MPLNDYVFKSDFESLRDDVVEEFYLPALREAVIYKRAVGYFTSRALELVFQGLEEFVFRKGKIQLITSPELDPSDVEQMRLGYDFQSKVEEKFDKAISKILNDNGFELLGLLGTLVASGVLEVKVAFTSEGEYLFHSKYGIFVDAHGNRIAFNGSNNETERAIRKNHESFEVYCNWRQEDKERVAKHESKFDKLWLNEPEYCEVIDFPNVAKERLVKLGKEWREKRQIQTGQLKNKLVEKLLQLLPDFTVPNHLSIRDYQRDAIEAWWKNGRRGIFSMATGTGKTKTALIAAANVYKKICNGESNPGLLILIIVPYESLVGQWAGDVTEFGVSPVQVKGSYGTWIDRLAGQIHELNLGSRKIAIAISTNSSFAGEKFQATVNRSDVPMMVIADEVHNLGARTYIKALPKKAELRLGLSATPERDGDEEGTAALFEYFGGKVFEYSMQQAIASDFLTKYRYYPRAVELSEEESERYIELTRKIDRLAAQQENPFVESDEQPSQLKKLLIERSRVLAHAEQKIEAFRHDILKNKHQFHQLIYCAEGSSPLNKNSSRQIDQIQEMISDELGIKSAKYVSETDTKTRASLLEMFESANGLQALTSMRCLDEGVDIPNAQIGYILASTTNYRQYIQRRGRLLRLSEGKTVAEIYDYVIVPSETHDRKIARKLLKNELRRTEEFRKLAVNASESSRILDPLKQRFGLLDI